MVLRDVQNGAFLKSYCGSVALERAWGFVFVADFDAQDLDVEIGSD